MKQFRLTDDGALTAANSVSIYMRWCSLNILAGVGLYFSNRVIERELLIRSKIAEYIQKASIVDKCNLIFPIDVNPSSVIMTRFHSCLYLSRILSKPVVFV